MFHHRWFGESLYCSTRTVRLRAIVETDVEVGLTSYCWLHALYDNDFGTLFSTDLPTIGSTARVNADGKVDRSHVEIETRTGAFVPPSVRRRWELTLGEAKVELPAVLSKVGTCEIAFADVSSDVHRTRIYWPSDRPTPGLLRK